MTLCRPIYQIGEFISEKINTSILYIQTLIILFQGAKSFSDAMNTLLYSFLQLFTICHWKLLKGETENKNLFYCLQYDYVRIVL